MKRTNRKISYGIILGFSLFLIINPVLIMLMIQDNSIINQNEKMEEKTPISSAIIGFYNLTNPIGINNTRFNRSDTIQIIGRVFNITNFNQGFDGLTVEVVVDGNNPSGSTDITSGGGIFNISFLIPSYIDIYNDHRLTISVTSGGPPASSYAPYGVENYYNISVFGDSKIKINWLSSIQPSRPMMPGENFNIVGKLELDNGTGLTGIQYHRYWINQTYTTEVIPTKWSGVGGAITDNFNIPANITDNNITLRYSYLSLYPNDYSATNLSIFFSIFRNVTILWNIASNATVGEGLTIQGRVVSTDNLSMGISYRNVNIYYNGTQIFNPTTDANGNFSVIYQVPYGQGAFSIQVGFVDPQYGWIILSDVEHNVTVSAPPVEIPPITPPSAPAAPFGDFLLILIPIIVIIGGAVAILGYLFLRKQEQESMSVSVPLESRIKNLKILKDTGRLEEALSYLFNAVYMDLINAKFARTKKVSETIRDFAIVSVKELNLNPATIYPFIQKVEEIIYARPYSITERDFYDACGLFSPIYFQLTGYNFVLNF